MPSLEKVHHFSSIGTFLLTIVVVAIMVIPMLWPSQMSPQQHAGTALESKPMIGWLLPSILSFSLVLAGVLHFLAARATNAPKPRPTQTGTSTETSGLSQ
jgi:hypothetical protein